MSEKCWSDCRIRHLEMIQGVITRMAGNSFALKGWSVALAVGFMILATSAGSNLLLTALFPLVFFAGLDAYYLSLERNYRSLYKQVCEQSDDKDVFNMAAPQVANWFCCLFAPCVWLFYLPLMAAVAVIALR